MNWFQLLLGVAMVFAGGLFIVSAAINSLPKVAAKTVAVEAPPIKERWKFRFDGYAKEFNDDFDRKVTPTIARFSVDDAPEPDAVEAAWSREGDAFIVRTEDPDFQRFMDQYWDTHRIVLHFGWTADLGSGDQTIGAHVIIRDGVKKVAADVKSRSEAEGTTAVSDGATKSE